MKISLGFSSCPNDTYIFDALVHKKIDTRGIDFEYTIADVQELNARAFNGDFHITKLSYFAYAHITHLYQILDSGSALGFENGPLFICKQKLSNITPTSRIAIPGEQTTAHLLFSLAYPEFTNKKFYIFSDIEQAITNHEVDAGVIIHENRFTFEERGFTKICDLGTYWEQQTHLPIPLGAIVVARNLDIELKQTINTLIKESILFARENPKEPMHFINTYAQEMNEDVKQKHISLFVNDFSIDLGTTGKLAIKELYNKAKLLNLIPLIENELFLNP